MHPLNVTAGRSFVRFLIVVSILAIAAGLILPEIGKRKVERSLSQAPPEFSIERGKAGAEDAQLFRFRFDHNQPLTYANKTRFNVDVDMQAPMGKVRTTTGFELSYNLSLALKERLPGDVNTLQLEPSRLRGDWDITAPEGHVIVKLRGSDITATRDGKTIIDTKRGIGLQGARQLKDEIAPMYKRGEIDVDSRGNVLKVRGTAAFVRFWKEASEGQLGLFGIVFPEEAIATGDTWKGSLLVKKLGKISLKKPGLRCPVKVTRSTDTFVNGRAVCQFTIAAPLRRRNLVGYMTQDNQRTRVNVTSLNRNSSGAARFDSRKGVLVDMSTKIDATGVMKMSQAGKTATLNMVVSATADMRLLP